MQKWNSIAYRPAIHAPWSVLFSSQNCGGIFIVFFANQEIMPFQRHRYWWLWLRNSLVFNSVCTYIEINSATMALTLPEGTTLHWTSWKMKFIIFSVFMHTSTGFPNILIVAGKYFVVTYKGRWRCWCRSLLVFLALPG